MEQITTQSGDQCATCGAPLASDQRYCVQCGQRRGQTRLPVAQTATVTVAAPRAARVRMTPSTTLIAGVGTLLLAMGVGVLIGRSGQKSTVSRASAPVQVVTVAGGGGTAAAATPTKRTAKQRKAAAKSSKTTKSPSAAQVAKSVKGTSIKLPAKAVVKVGQPGHGPGYQKGKFTGNFFGGG
ncbi:MAG: hypothetical protein JWM71_732 [Solirubrobacteraceae bacterium]|nr:hypothetical protein [Solirubrobacteraceae bacterium]